MKKIFSGAIVGAIILFGWQSISWTAVGIHENSFKYAPAQDSIIQFLQNNLREEGHFRIPSELPGATNEEAENYWKKMEGKPWAMITYHSYYKNDMVSPLVRGLLVAFLCVLLVCITIHQFPKKKFGNVFFTTLSFGMVSFLFVSYNQHNWFQTPWHYLNGELADTLIGWTLCGIWLALWNKRK